jgi:hypothetical protein
MEKSERIYNADEEGCRLRLNKQPKVLGQKGTKRVHIVAHEHEGEYFSSFMRKRNWDCSTTRNMSYFLFLYLNLHVFRRKILVGHIISTVQVI